MITDGSHPSHITPNRPRTPTSAQFKRPSSDYAKTLTLRKVADAQHRAVNALDELNERAATLRQTLTECDTKLKNYRAALDAGGDPAVIAGWIKETTALRTATQAMIGAQRTAPARMTDDQINRIVEGLGGLLGLLRDADPLDHAEVYARIGLQLTYQPGPETVIAEVTSSAIDGVDDVCRRGDPAPHIEATRTMQVLIRGS